ncbi:protein takeout isoform X1 [Halyomorpha halys]|uniref:protein takeout isoform X1 n=1 Tax=Halyomorpha halys TaxID=286706 RepID=UPI0006D4F9E7|nr:protein takeout-like [Halyomorpha halys]
MLLRLSSLLFLAGQLHSSSAAIPSYIHICKRNDPKIDQCITNSINALRQKLIEGIPELEVPTLDPLLFDEFIISDGGHLKAIGTNVVVRGASNYKITSLKADVNKLIFNIVVEFPFLVIVADYNVNMKILAINLEGKGPLQSNNTDVSVHMVVKASKIQKAGGTYVLFDNMDLKIKWKDYNIRLENLFGGDKLLGEAVNVALNENKQVMIELIRPMLEKKIAEKLLGIANKITQHFTYGELFPAK